MAEQFHVNRKQNFEIFLGCTPEDAMKRILEAFSDLDNESDAHSHTPWKEVPESAGKTGKGSNTFEIDAVWIWNSIVAAGSDAETWRSANAVKCFVSPRQDGTRGTRVLVESRVSGYKDREVTPQLISLITRN